MKKIRVALLSLTTFFALQAAGCRVSPTDPKLSESGPGKACTGNERAMIGDGDDNNNQVIVIDGRGGYWYTFSDDAGTEVWPTAGALGGTFEMSPGGAENTPYAARFKGKIAATNGPAQAGVGLNFLDPKGAYDASQYGGISFWAKKGSGSIGKVRVKVPDAYTDPDAGNCSECFNDFGMDILVTEQWQHFVLPFNSLKQMPGWGKPRRFGVSEDALFGVQFQVSEAGQAFDIWIDQIRFTGCE